MNQVREKHGNIFRISESDYKSVREPLRIYCTVHKLYLNKSQAGLVKSGNPCQYCVKDQRLRDHIAKVLTRLEESYPQFELKSDVTNFNCEMILKCPIHGDFETTSNQVLYLRAGCKDCGRQATGEKLRGSQRVSFDEFKQRFAERYGSRLSLISDEQDYENFNSLLTVKCSVPEHAEFQNTAKDLLRYHGCKNCKESMGERLVRIALEVLEIAYEQEKRFASCRDRKELPFDFWLPDFSTLIEFQGKQHEVPADRFGGERALKGTQKRDKIKKEWASENGINLIYISDYTNIKSTIAQNLEGAINYDSELVLDKIKEKEKKWIEEKWKEYFKKLIKVHKTKYDFSKTKWSWGQKEIEYECQFHGKRIGNLQSLLKGHGCRACSGQEANLETVIRRSNKKFGNLFCFCDSIFAGMSKKMEITCILHGKMFISPEEHLRWSKGCKECGPQAETGSSDRFLKMARDKFGVRFDYRNLNFRDTSKKVKIRCNKHEHTFQILPGDHTRNDTGGCEYCVAESKSATHSKSIVVEGVTYKSFQEAASQYGLKSATVRRRLKLNWKVDAAFTTPLRGSA